MEIRPHGTLSKYLFALRTITERRKRCFKRIQRPTLTDGQRRINELLTNPLCHKSDLLSSLTTATARRINPHLAKHSQKIRMRVIHTSRGVVRSPDAQSPIRLSMHATIRSAERIFHTDLSRVRMALAVVVSGHHSPSTASNLAHLTQNSTNQSEAGSEADLFAFLLVLCPTTVELWSSTLLRLVEPYQAWPVSDFNIVNRNFKVRIVIKNRVVVTVAPLSRLSRSA